MDLGNFVAVALVFGQFIGEKQFSEILFVNGVVLTLSCYIISYLIDL